MLTSMTSDHDLRRTVTSGRVEGERPFSASVNDAEEAPANGAVARPAAFVPQSTPVRVLFSVKVPSRPVLSNNDRSVKGKEANTGPNEMGRKRPGSPLEISRTRETRLSLARITSAERSLPGSSTTTTSTPIPIPIEVTAAGKKRRTGRNAQIQAIAAQSHLARSTGFLHERLPADNGTDFSSVAVAYQSLCVRHDRAVSDDVGAAVRARLADDSICGIYSALRVTESLVNGYLLTYPGELDHLEPNQQREHTEKMRQILFCLAFPPPQRGAITPSAIRVKRDILPAGEEDTKDDIALVSDRDAACEDDYAEEIPGVRDLGAAIRTVRRMYLGTDPTFGWLWSHLADIAVHSPDDSVDIRPFLGGRPAYVQYAFLRVQAHLLRARSPANTPSRGRDERPEEHRANDPGDIPGCVVLEQVIERFPDEVPSTTDRIRQYQTVRDWILAFDPLLEAVTHDATGDIGQRLAEWSDRRTAIAKQVICENQIAMRRRLITWAYDPPKWMNFDIPVLPEDRVHEYARTVGGFPGSPMRGSGTVSDSVATTVGRWVRLIATRQGIRTKYGTHAPWVQAAAALAAIISRCWIDLFPRGRRWRKLSVLELVEVAYRGRLYGLSPWYTPEELRGRAVDWIEYVSRRSIDPEAPDPWDNRPPADMTGRSDNDVRRQGDDDDDENEPERDDAPPDLSACPRFDVAGDPSVWEFLNDMVTKRFGEEFGPVTAAAGVARNAHIVAMADRAAALRGATDRSSTSENEWLTTFEDPSDVFPPLSSALSRRTTTRETFAKPPPVRGARTRQKLNPHPVDQTAPETAPGIVPGPAPSTPCTPLDIAVQGVADGWGSFLNPAHNHNGIVLPSEVRNVAAAIAGPPVIGLQKDIRADASSGENAPRSAPVVTCEICNQPEDPGDRLVSVTVHASEVPKIKRIGQRQPSGKTPSTPNAAQNDLRNLRRQIERWAALSDGVLAFRVKNYVASKNKRWAEEDQPSLNKEVSPGPQSLKTGSVQAPPP